MISKKMSEGLVHQINREMYSAYFYLAMASYAQDIGLSGVANWFNIQVKEELSHAMKIFTYLEQREVRVMLHDIEKPPQDFKSVADLFKLTLDHERKVTTMINDLFSLAQQEKDRATEIMLQWFVTEQVEEEASVSEILQKLELFGEKGDALMMIDRELGQRAYTTTAG